MNPTLWRIKRRFKYNWRNHRLKLVLFCSTFIVTFITALSVTIVFIFTGRAFVSDPGLVLTTQEKELLYSTERSLENCRSGALNYLRSSFSGICEQQAETLKSSLEQDRGYEISLNFVSLYECFRANQFEMSKIGDLGTRLSEYSHFLQEYNELREIVLSKLVSTDKERRSLISFRLKSSLLPFYLRLVKHSIDFRQRINEFKSQNQGNPQVVDLLNNLSQDVSSATPHISNLVGMFSENDCVSIHETFIKPILESLIECNMAILHENRRWKQIQKFKYSLKSDNSKDSFDKARFKTDNPVVFLNILIIKNRLFTVKQAFGSSKFFVQLWKALADSSLFSSRDIRGALVRLNSNNNVESLLDLHKLTQSHPKYDSLIKPIIAAYEEHSKYRLLSLGTRSDLKYHQALLTTPDLKEADYRAHEGSETWKLFLYHKYNDYLILVKNNLTAKK